MTSRGSVRSHSVRHSGYGKVVDDEKEGLPNYTQVVSVLVQMQARNVTTHLHVLIHQKRLTSRFILEKRQF